MFLFGFVKKYRELQRENELLKLKNRCLTAERDGLKSTMEHSEKMLQDHLATSCNVCDRKGNCPIEPKWGEPVRCRCAYFVKRGGEEA